MQTSARKRHVTLKEETGGPTAARSKSTNSQTAAKLFVCAPNVAPEQIPASENRRAAEFDARTCSTSTLSCIFRNASKTTLSVMRQSILKYKRVSQEEQNWSRKNRNGIGTGRGAGDSCNSRAVVLVSFGYRFQRTQELTMSNLNCQSVPRVLLLH